MPIYNYRAKNLNGHEISDSNEYASLEFLEAAMREKGYFVVESSIKAREFNLGAMFGKVNRKDIAVFCRQFAVIVNAGVTIVEAVNILCEQTEKKMFADVLNEIREELQKGKMLSETLKMYPDVFPDFMTSMVQVGESSGSLDVVMERLADYYEKENRLMRKVSSAMTYPIILAVVTVGVVVLLMTKVLPMFADMLSQMGGDLPLITKILMGISGFMVKNIIAIGLIVVLAIASISYFFKSEAGRYWFDGLKLSLPIIKKTNVKVMTSRFARSMGILLKSGMQIISAIEIMGSLMGNKVIEEKFMSFREEVKGGRGIAGPLEKLEIFPPLLIHMVKVGETTGELDEMLTRTAGFFDEEVEEAVEKMTALIEPVMIIVLAAVVGTIIISIMLPMLSIMTAVK